MQVIAGFLIPASVATFASLVPFSMKAYAETTWALSGVTFDGGGTAVDTFDTDNATRCFSGRFSGEANPAAPCHGRHWTVESKGRPLSEQPVHRSEQPVHRVDGSAAGNADGRERESPYFQPVHLPCSCGNARGVAENRFQGGTGRLDQRRIRLPERSVKRRPVGL